MSSYDRLFIGGGWVPPSTTSTLDYGLGGSVWTSDSDRAGQWPAGSAHRHRGHQRLPAGPGQAPWGGVKSSGLGRSAGPRAVAAYQNLKTVYA